MYVCIMWFTHEIKYVPYTGKFWQTIQVKAIGEEKFGD